MKKRIVAALAVFLMLMQVLPMTVLAASDQKKPEKEAASGGETFASLSESSLGEGGRTEIDARPGDLLQLRYTDISGDVYQWNSARWDGTKWIWGELDYVQITGGRNSASVRVLAPGRFQIDYLSRIDFYEGQPGAQWFINSSGSPIGCRVYYNANGGTCDRYSEYVYYDQPYGTLPVPERGQYVFDGWYTNLIGGEKIAASTIVKAIGNHTLYARWLDPPKYTITLDPAGGTVSRSYILRRKEDRYGKLPDPIRSGHIFLGWYTERGERKNPEDQYDPVSDGSALTARWADEQTGPTGDLVYTLSGTTLTLSGNGASADYEKGEDVPWYAYRDAVKNIVIREGVTTLGAVVFENHIYAENLSLPHSLESIGEDAFYHCDRLKAVRGHENLKEIGIPHLTAAWG